MAQANSVKSIIYALVANFAIAIAKLVAAFITNSGSMMAESIHSFADCGNQGLLLLGVKNAKRPPDLKHPLGYGKTVYFWSFIVAIMLFSMGGLFSIYEGSHKLHETDGLSSPLIAIGVLVFAIIAESLCASCRHSYHDHWQPALRRAWQYCDRYSSADYCYFNWQGSERNDHWTGCGNIKI